ncbi:hypothetical protein [Poseidonibacter lekithochrous]|uniref:hypothetical protein n=1 Tax=Poseidonibacter lekithochrous TaxID=1904463 RepID=UPI000D3C81D7|nr:hypothetical protein [Poseidonibacter lekithochrous]
MEFNSWTWLDFMINTFTFGFFIVGIYLFLPYTFYKYFMMGLKYGFIQKVKDEVLGNYSILTKLTILLIAFGSGVYYLFIENIFYTKYWDKVLLFFS